jgi:hypothetical protein
MELLAMHMPSSNDILVIDIKESSLIIIKHIEDDLLFLFSFGYVIWYKRLGKFL